MKTFKGVSFASIVFDVYLQVNDVIKETLYPVFELICVTFSLPPGVGGWLRLLLVDLPGLFCLPFCIKNIFCLHNDWNVIICKTEKVQIYGKSFIALPAYTVRNAYCLTARKQISDMNMLY